MKKIILFALFITATFLTTKAQFTKLHDFDSPNGGSPAGDLISEGTFLYGMTTYGGTDQIGVVFKIKPDGTEFAKLLDFTGAANGSNPGGALISDGTFLYGMTQSGGTNDMGVIFKIKPDGTGYVKLLDFDGAANGAGPLGSLISDGTFLYGMTIIGGTNGLGVIFKIMPDGTGYVKLLDFNGAANGRNPFGSLISDGTFLYGMTAMGGTNDAGTIFKIKPDGSGYSKLLDFAVAANGSFPWGHLISDGVFLYGMTEQGGTNGLGALFKIKPDGTGYSKLLDFDSTNGGSPRGSLISDGNFLYGMTAFGGTNDMGVLFKIKPDGTGYSNLLDFTGNGNLPIGALISDGTFLYGMTGLGGTNDNGVIFKYQDSTATGIAEHPAKGGFNVYPNPTSGKFTIERDGRQGGTRGEAEIYNVVGEKVFETTISEPSSAISLNVPGGIYFIHIITELGTASRKMVVRH